MPVDLLPKPNPLTGRHHQQTASTPPIAPAPLVAWSSVKTDGSAGGSITPTLPAGIANGDLMVMVVFAFGTALGSSPPATGWSNISGGTHNNSGTTGTTGTLITISVTTRVFTTGYTIPAITLTTSTNRGAFVAVGAFRPTGTATVNVSGFSDTALTGATTISVQNAPSLSLTTGPVHYIAFSGWMATTTTNAPGTMTSLVPTWTESLESGPSALAGSAAGSASVLPTQGGFSGATTAAMQTVNSGTLQWTTSSVASNFILGIVDSGASTSWVTVPFSSLTYGAWTQLLASTTYAGRLLVIRWASGLPTTAQYFVDIGTGGAGSETVVAPMVPFIPRATTGGGSDADVQEIWVPISAGQRVAIRVWARGIGGTSGQCVAHLID